LVTIDKLARRSAKAQLALESLRQFDLKAPKTISQSGFVKAETEAVQ
jgi:hypothetical protein